MSSNATSDAPTLPTTHYLYLIHPPRPSFVRDASPSEMAIMGAHMAYLQQLLAAGKLLLAGPCVDGVYGVAILKVTEPSEAERIAAGDPAVVQGLVRPELHPISAGISAV
jgi:uncharacterized protein